MKSFCSTMKLQNCAGQVVLLSNLSKRRRGATCAMYKDDFWIVGGRDGTNAYLDTVESFSLRYKISI
jgi:hypothetical protein